MLAEEESKLDQRKLAEKDGTDNICYVCCTAIERECDLYLT